MTQFEIHCQESAPEGAQTLLAGLQRELGFVPKIYGVIAGSPAALEGVMALNTSFGASGFSGAEREIISLATSVANACPYCIAGHTAFALQEGVPQDIIDAVREDRPILDPTLEALRSTTRTVVLQRGEIAPDQFAHFCDAGFSKEAFLELLLGVAAKTMTNFASKVAGLPADAEFAAAARSPEFEHAL